MSAIDYSHYSTVSFKVVRKNALRRVVSIAARLEPRYENKTLRDEARFPSAFSIFYR